MDKRNPRWSTFSFSSSFLGATVLAGIANNHWQLVVGAPYDLLWDLGVGALTAFVLAWE
jgi:hypothetical protein